MTLDMIEWFPFLHPRALRALFCISSFVRSRGMSSKPPQEEAEVLKKLLWNALGHLALMPSQDG